MTRKVKALLVFCEGPHDVAFVRRVLKHCLGFTKVEWKFSEFPAPFNSLFKTNVERHAAQDLSLDMAHKFFLPDRVLRREDVIALVFNSGGKTKRQTIVDFLSGFLSLFEHAAVFPDRADAIVTQARFLFLYDADDLGVEKIREDVKADFGSIDDKPWLVDGWQIDAADPAGAIAGDKALYVWSGKSGQGTLEDILMPVLRKSEPKLSAHAESQLETLFTWETEHERRTRSIAERTKKHKATITLAGQREKPGMSMSVILDQTQVLKDDILAMDTRVASFARYLASFIDVGPQVDKN
ncbi:DUF3226 domain-containing protein [Candidatus Thiosymbion oneisti]|uniref:DUF3226 domain-containing protein n=1 Tax=Candidatus Thiosymbion oneisti TaxID=589554 RepID=UPI00105FF6CA|nr:DUF3226 domain-containing protein [Candidatus Thiosymbion oneisti]